MPGNEDTGQQSSNAFIKAVFSPDLWLVPFCLSDRLKFAIKVALSLTLAYLIPMSMGWPQASTAATTVMLIASISSQRESLAKGTLRVMGTLIGAGAGLLLVGLFAQDRLLYMLAVSLLISFVFYIRNAYKQDPTLFMLCGVMILMMSNGGDANGAFIYGLDRAYMTIFGVVIYTLVGVFVFPAKTEQNLIALADKLGVLQRQVFERAVNASKVLSAQPDSEYETQALIKQLYNAQEALEQHYKTVSAECSDVSAYKHEWDLALNLYKQITLLLISVTDSDDKHVLDMSSFITNYQSVVLNIDDLFLSVRTAWSNKEALSQIEKIPNIEINNAVVNVCSHLQKSTVITNAYLLKKLHKKLMRLSEIIRSIDSLNGSLNFEETLPDKLGRFLWWDAENAKTAIKVFITYWLAGILWIYFNPPGGYSFVIFSTIFVSILSFIPVHPIVLLVLFTFGFLFAVPSYIFILPNLSLGIELGVFLFIYTLIAFYMFKGPVTIFFLLGLFILGIDNTMNYHFGVILSIILLFYLVVFMIIISHYFPFSSKPEHLFLVIRERFFRHANGVISFQQSSQSSYLHQLRYRWHMTTMNVSSKKLLPWASKIDRSYFKKNSPETLSLFTDSCQLLCDHLNTFSAVNQKLKNNRLAKKVGQAYKNQLMATATQTLANDYNADVLGKTFDAYNYGYESAEKKLELFFNSLPLSEYTHSEISEFYILVHLKKNVYEAINQCKVAYDEVDWVSLKKKRF